MDSFSCPKQDLRRYMWIYSIQQVKVAKEIGPKKKMRGGAKSVLFDCVL